MVIRRTQLRRWLDLRSGANCGSKVRRRNEAAEFSLYQLSELERRPDLRTTVGRTGRRSEAPAMTCRSEPLSPAGKARSGRRSRVFRPQCHKSLSSHMAEITGRRFQSVQGEEIKQRFRPVPGQRACPRSNPRSKLSRLMAVTLFLDEDHPSSSSRTRCRKTGSQNPLDREAGNKYRRKPLDFPSASSP